MDCRNLRLGLILICIVESYQPHSKCMEKFLILQE